LFLISKLIQTIPIYDEVVLDHDHSYNGSKFLPVLGSAAIDHNNDGVSEVFLGGGENQDDALYRYTSKGFELISEIKFNKAGNDSTYGASVVDINNDGLDDLILARESGGYIYYNTGDSFRSKKIEF